MTRAVSWILPHTMDDTGTQVGSAGAAALLHVLIVVLLLVVGGPTEQRSGVTGWTLDVNAGGGGQAGGGIHLLQLTVPPVAEAVPDLPALPDLPTLPSLVAPTLPDLIPQIVSPPVLAFDSSDDCFGACNSPNPGSSARARSGLGTGVGPGSETGAGAGAGPGGDGVRPPAPITIMIPPTATAAVRGKAATMLLQVDTVGAVWDADVVVSSGDRNYDEALRRIAMGWRFRPARDTADRPVPYPFEVSVAF